MEREVGGGIGMGNTCKPMAFSFQCMTNSLQKKKKDSSVKDRNGMDLTEDIKKRWQEYTELYKKDPHDPDNHNGVTTHIEPDILECEVKWALGSITTNKS